MITIWFADKRSSDAFRLLDLSQGDLESAARRSVVFTHCPDLAFDSRIMDYLLLAFSLTDWLWDSWYELRHYTTHLNKTQWGIMAASSVLFGFVCLKGNPIRH